MKSTINLRTKRNLSRAEMKTIVAGNKRAPSLSDTATVMCNDETQHTVASCDQMDAACVGHGGAKICSGGGN